MNKKITALALFSGGLDSILACRVMQARNINIQAVQFVTPFFHYDLPGRKGYVDYIKRKYDISVIVRDISESYLPMLKNPPHGYGKHFNPCIDCKILMVRQAKKMMAQFNASFIISGEVTGQRPMSQRKDTMRIIERDSETEGILFRPLCVASTLQAGRGAFDDIINFDQLPDFSGRGRNGQLKLAAEMGITDFPNPGGGCMLADPALGRRIRNVFTSRPDVTIPDVCFLLVGRQFFLPDGGWLAVGRNQKENNQVEALCQSGDYLLNMKDRPGPTALLRYCTDEYDLNLAGGIVARYARKINNQPAAGMVTAKKNDNNFEFAVDPFHGDITRWQR